MTDPEYGDPPSRLGAPAERSPRTPAGHPADGGRSRIGNADEAGAMMLSARQGADAPVSNGKEAPDNRPAGPKRKRRRNCRRSNVKDAGSQTEARSAMSPQASSPGKQGQNRHGKSRSRKRRALQGRPLTCASNGPADTLKQAAAQGRADRPRDGAETAQAGLRNDEGGRGRGHRKGELPHNASGRGEARPARLPFNPPLYAALDLGTNNCRLLIAQPTRPGQFRVVDAFSRIVRLGEGLVGTGRLSPGVMDRAVEALKICAAKLGSRPIRGRRLIATEACRSAANGVEFLERVKKEAGLDLEIVDRETEARLAVSGCSSLVGRDARSVVLFDIGGGSSEIAVINFPAERGGRLTNHIKAWTSLPVGVVTLSEQHGGREVTRDVFAAMVSDVERMLGRFDCPRSLTGHEKDGDAGFHLLGTSGTVTTLAGVYLDLPRYDRRRVDGLWLSNDDVDRMMDRLLSWDFDQRSANPCIGADRADLVLAGCAILEAIRRRWPAKRMRVADRGLREGLLTEMMAADGVWRRSRRGRGHGHDRPRGGSA